MCDMMHASRRVPMVAVERQFRLAELIDARARLAVRPSWFALFLKGWAIVSSRRPELRQAYLPFPWPRIHEHACTVAHLAVARCIGDEDAVLALQIRNPEKKSLTEIDAIIRRSRTEPVEQFGDFRRALRLGRLPLPIRRFAWWVGLCTSGSFRARFAGTFGITGIAALGSTSLHLLSPLTTTLTYGVFTPDGTAPVRLFFDHRIMDGVQPAAALDDLEKVMCGEIRAELRDGIRRAA
jgi:hypothetical protein